MLGPGELPLQIITCQVESIDELSSSVYRVFLRPPAEKIIRFYAGQYLSIQILDKEPSFFSIASAPSERLIELHIQALPGWTSAEFIVDCLTKNKLVNVELPYGKACLVDDAVAVMGPSPIVLMAAGTGFSQMKSIMETLVSKRCTQEVHLFWGVRQPEDMYLRDLPEQWSSQFEHFSFYPVLGDNPDNEWSGHHDGLWKAVLNASLDITMADFFISGSPDMVYASVQGLTQAGATEKQFHSDVFEYAPKCKK